MEFPSTPLPDRRQPASHVLDQLRAMKADDRRWDEGKVFGLVYDAGPEHHELLRDAMALFEAENGLNVLAFPSIGQMAYDLVQLTGRLLGGGMDGPVAGHLTSGGTESLLQAVKVARDAGRARGITRPTVVCATSAHAAFTKAGQLFDVEIVRVPVGEDFRADVAAMAEAVTDQTVLLVASAVSYPHGVVDDVVAIAAIAKAHGTLCHVDACMGGFFLPFLAELGRFSTPFDLSVDGVTSISADLHKYGYASKGVSVVCYATEELARHQLFVTNDWLGGFYASTTMAGTKPAGPIASAWASVMALGRQGLRELTAVADDAAQVIEDAVRANPRLRLLGEPAMAVFAIAAAAGDDLDVFAVAEHLAADGWHLDRQHSPDALHLTVHAGSAKATSAFVQALTAAVDAVGSNRTTDRSTTYATGA